MPSRGDNTSGIDTGAALIGGETRVEDAGREVRVSPAAIVTAALAAGGAGVMVVWAWRDGGYAPEEWLPGGLLLLALLCTASAAADVRARWRVRPQPLLFLGGYVAWSYASILWAQVPGDALDGANRTLVYWLAFALFYGLGLGERLGGAVVLVWGVALAALGLIALAEAGAAAAPAGHFVLGRLAAPISYPDGDAALFLVAGIPLLALASRRQTSPVSRLIAGPAAVVLADLSVLCQSRGSLFALPCALVLYLAVARGRLRSLAHFAVAAAAVAPAVPALLRVYSAVVAGHGRGTAVSDSCVWIAASAGVAVLGFSGLMLLERHVRLPRGFRVLLGRTLLAAAAAAVVSAALLVGGSHPLGRAERAWRDFTTNKAASPTKQHFSAGFGTTRYDVWRVAVRQFLAHPVEGVGADNFLVEYLRQRQTAETSRYPSSVVLRAFSETGIVGAALFVGFLALVFWRAVRAARRLCVPGLALACLGGGVYWLLHGSIDWFWELPAITGSALMMLAIAASPNLSDAFPPANSKPLRWLKTGLATSAALLAGAALAIPWASVSLVDAALARGATRSSYSLLTTAASLNPWSEQPALAEATLAAKIHDRAKERRALLKAESRNPHDWYPYFMLGILAGREHHPIDARKELAHAHRLSPHDLVVVYAQRRLKVDEPLSQREVAKIFREVTSTLRGVRQR